MILVDVGPLVALFTPADHNHGPCVAILESINEELVTTAPVLTEAFHLLRPGSQGPPRLMEFVRQGGLRILPMDDHNLLRCFRLMDRHADLAMDFADASLVATAESIRIHKVFTLDSRRFAEYRVKRGHRRVPLSLVLVEHSG